MDTTAHARPLLHAARQEGEKTDEKRKGLCPVRNSRMTVVLPVSPSFSQTSEFRAKLMTDPHVQLSRKDVQSVKKQIITDT
jgi:hypothetical protein